MLFAELGILSALTFGVPPDHAYKVSQTSLGQAAQYEQLYVYDPAQDAMVDQQTGEIYYNVEGTFTSEAGKKLTPGLCRDDRAGELPGALHRPDAALHLRAGLSLDGDLCPHVGLPDLRPGHVPGHRLRRARDAACGRLLRSLLLIPYAIPAFVAVPVWVGLLNPQFGVISLMIARFTGGWVPPWFSDPFWAKVGILLIQTWLGFPYMFVVVTGALQTLPNDIYEAADLDGANAWDKFQSMTLPLLLVTVGPLLVASFAFNFNNFTVIHLYNSGGPPMPNTPTPVGYTDILATYTYNIAFGSQGVQITATLRPSR